MKAEITGVSEGVSRTGDGMTTYFSKLEGGSARTYVVESHRNKGRWADIKEGDQVEGLKWKDEVKKLIDADSLVKVVN